MNEALERRSDDVGDLGPGHVRRGDVDEVDGAVGKEDEDGVARAVDEIAESLRGMVAVNEVIEQGRPPAKRLPQIGGRRLRGVNLGRALSTFGKSAALRLGSEGAGRRLLADFRSADETVRMLAGMFLVRNGNRSVPILREALARREEMPAILTMLGDIATDDAGALIRQYVDDQDPEVAAAARAALDILGRNRMRS
ncbi:MAG TPA: hypothetical protein VG323_20155 [Thermoanaerobaculia bacterium]|nr:hypothetical protein [Thermoanaerobaculia bacterium]